MSVYANMIQKCNNSSDAIGRSTKTQRVQKSIHTLHDAHYRSAWRARGASALAYGMKLFIPFPFGHATAHRFRLLNAIYNLYFSFLLTSYACNITSNLKMLKASI